MSAFAVHNIAFSIVLWTWPNFSLSAPLNGLCKGIATPQATPRAPPAPVWEGEALAQQTSRPEVEDAAWAKSTQLSVSGFPPNVSWTQVWLGQKKQFSLSLGAATLSGWANTWTQFGLGRSLCSVIPVLVSQRSGEGSNDTGLACQKQHGRSFGKACRQSGVHTSSTQFWLPACCKEMEDTPNGTDAGLASALMKKGCHGQRFG